jgi:hypothetical protein
VTIQEYILKNGPTLSSDLIKYFQREGLSNDAIRKRLSRIADPIYKIRGFFKDNQTFFYHNNHYDDGRFYESLRSALKISAKKYYSIITALEYHNGYIKKEHLASYSFSPVSNLKSHKKFSDVINDLIKLKIITEEDEYYKLSELFSNRVNSNFNFYRAVELAKGVIGDQFYNYTRNIGLISYERGRFNSEFSKFQFCFTAPSYVSGIVKYIDRVQPAFVIADVLIGNRNDESSVDFFIQKIQIIKTQTSSNFLPFLITDTLTQEAFKKLKENGIIIGFVDKLFGEEYQELLKSLISVVTNAGTILKTNPEAYLDLLIQLNKLVVGKTNNLRGDIFELAVGYYYSNLCQSLDIGKKINYQGNYKEVDVYTTFQDKYVVCECKAYKTMIDLKVVENWLGNKVPFIYKAIREYNFDKGIVFEFWSTSGFTNDAIDFLRERQAKLKKYKIEFYAEKEILSMAKKSKTNKIIEIMREYFSNDV